MSQNGKLKVAELFAGVGGFRLGLEGHKAKSKESRYKVVWSNQWEPATKAQHASDIYVLRFGEEGHSNEDIATVDVKDIPDHDLLVGGFPCQDYSVAKSLNQAQGIVGEKGVLWWEIYRILFQKKKKPKYLMLENVDRLLKSPASQRGRDFALMLASLSDLGYAVEWRVINAADYGFPQRRRRIFILGYYKNTPMYKKFKNAEELSSIIFDEGVFAKSFPIKKANRNMMYPTIKLKGDLVKITKDFGTERKEKSPFKEAGVMLDRKYVTDKIEPDYAGKRTLLKDILEPDEKVPEGYFIDKNSLEKWNYLKGAKSILRESKKTGKTFKYDEGAMVFPDALDKPSRTIITAEGGPSPSRFKHVVKGDSGKLRRLTPRELEMLNMFPPDFTKGVTDARRAFFMGNALVVGVVERLGKGLIKAIDGLGG